MAPRQKRQVTGGRRIKQGLIVTPPAGIPPSAPQQCLYLAQAGGATSGRFIGETQSDIQPRRGDRRMDMASAERGARTEWARLLW